MYTRSVPHDDTMLDRSTKAGSLPTSYIEFRRSITPIFAMMNLLEMLDDDDDDGNILERRPGISGHWKRAPGNYARRLYARLRAPFLPSWYIISRRNIYIKNYSSPFNLYRGQNFSILLSFPIFSFSFWQVIKLQRRNIALWNTRASLTCKVHTLHFVPSK